MVLAGALAINPSYAQEPTQPSFSVLHEKGLPESFKQVGEKPEQGYAVEDYIDRKTPREVVIITDTHSDNREFLKHDSRLIEFLMQEYQADSLGIEGIWGEVENQDFKPLENIFKGTELKGLLDNNSEARKSFFGALADSYKDIGIEFAFPDFKQHIGKIPVYGTENKELEEIMLIEKAIPRFTNKNQLEVLLDECRDIAKKRTDLPKTGLYFSGNRYQGINSIRILENNAEIYYRLRNMEFANNIQKYMEKYNSKRGIVFVGVGHTFHIPAEYYSPEIRSLQQILPYSCLTIKGTSLKPLSDEQDKFRKQLKELREITWQKQ